MKIKIGKWVNYYWLVLHEDGSMHWYYYKTNHYYKTAQILDVTRWSDYFGFMEPEEYE